MPRIPHLLFVLTSLWAFALAPVQAQRAEFNILKGDHVVGRIVALKHESAGRADYLMTSYAEVDLIVEQVVRTSMSAAYRNGTLSTCHSTVTVNGALRDSSHLATESGSGTCYVHPGPPEQRQVHATWSTARMYFEEPEQEAFIFVESLLAPCRLERTGEGRYTLHLSNTHRNRYVYANGVLQEIRVQRPLLSLVFRRG